MSKFDRKVRRAKAKAENKFDRWDDLVSYRDSCLESYITLHSQLVETEKKFKDDIDKDKDLALTIKGMNDTFIDIAESIRENMKRHTEPTDKLDKDGNPVVKFKSGIIKDDDHRYMDYMSIKESYVAILNNMLDTGPRLYTILLDKLKILNSNIQQADIDMINNAVDQGQDAILETIKKESKGETNG